MHYLGKRYNFSFFNNIFKLEITFLIDLVAIAGFFTNPYAMSHLILLIPLLVAGSFASMASGILNNIFDRDIDAKMNRVSKRREVVRLNSKIMVGLLILFLLVSLTVGLSFLSPVSVFFVMCGFVSYAVLYTMILKRRTDLNIVIGGIAGSFPAVAGSAAFMGIISPASIFIAVLVFVWTPTHFWSLAIKYKQDYSDAGIPMLPSVKGIPVTRRYILLNSIILAFVTVFPLIYQKMGLNFIYLYVSVPLALWMLIPSYYYFEKKGEAKEYRKLFSYTNGFLTLALIFIIFSTFTIKI